MANKRSAEKRKERQATGGFLAHVRKRESIAAKLLVKVQQRERLAPKFNEDALALAVEAVDIVQTATRLAAHQVEYEYRERAELAQQEAQTSTLPTRTAQLTACSDGCCALRQY